MILKFCFSNLYASNFDQHIINISYSGQDTIIIINKRSAAIDVLQVNQETKVIHTFSLLPLANLDNKNLATDIGTPEGIYSVKEEIFIKDFKQKEKKIALVLDYPNLADQYHKRTGSDIWIQAETSKQKENLSCFYMDSNDFSNFSQFVKKQNTPIIIIKDTSEPSNLFKNSTEWNQFLKHWQSTFSSNMLIEHSRLYIADNDQLDFEYAEKINQILTTPNSVYEFTIDNVIVLQSDEECRISFRFMFNSNNYRLNRQFSLALLPVNGEWKIFSENANYKPYIKLSSEEKIKEFLFKWKNAWESKVFKNYINFYSKNFSSNGQNYSQFSNIKQKALAQSDELKISIKDIKIEDRANNYLVSFKQDYWTPNYQDSGIKTLILENNNDSFFIIDEMWSEIADTIPNLNEMNLTPEKRLKYLIDSWKEAWENKNFSRYIALYSQNFSDGNRSFHEFYDHKQALFKNTNSVSVKINNIKIFQENGFWCAQFSQNFSTGEYQDFGLKTLYYDENFLIYNETWKEIALDSIFQTSQEPTKEHLELIIEHWKTSWENNNFDNYIALYSKEYSDRNHDYRQFFYNRQGSFKRNKIVKVTISNLEISRNDDLWIASFQQDYWTPTYQDKGTKKIKFKKYGNKYLIINESWTEISD